MKVQHEVEVKKRLCKFSFTLLLAYLFATWKKHLKTQICKQFKMADA